MLFEEPKWGGGAREARDDISAEYLHYNICWMKQTKLLI
jgi:hypothetical protein